MSVRPSVVCLPALLALSLPLAGFWAAWTAAREVRNTVLALFFPSGARLMFPRHKCDTSPLAPCMMLHAPATYRVGVALGVPRARVSNEQHPDKYSQSLAVSEASQTK